MLHKDASSQTVSRLHPAPRLAVVISPYYEAIVMGMLNGAKEFLHEHGVTIATSDIFTAPGAFEIPLIAQTLAKTGKYEGIICLGCVVKGDTAHFDYICSGTAHGIMNASLLTSVPIAFGVLTVYSIEQAEERSLPGDLNKGFEAANACLESVRALRGIHASAKAA